MHASPSQIDSLRAALNVFADPRFHGCGHYTHSDELADAESHTSATVAHRVYAHLFASAGSDRDSLSTRYGFRFDPDNNSFISISYTRITHCPQCRDKLVRRLVSVRRHVVIDQIWRSVDRAAVGKHAYFSGAEQTHFAVSLSNIRAAWMTVFAPKDPSVLRDRYFAVVPNQVQ